MAYKVCSARLGRWVSWGIVAVVMAACDCSSSPGPRDGGDDAGDGAVITPITCTGPEIACGSACCGGGEFCSATQTCCPFQNACGNGCCSDGEVCEGAVCHASCDGDASRRCADASGEETCCDAGQVCANGACFTPTTACDDFLECPDGHYCEAEVNGGTCLPQPGGAECRSTPTGSEIAPLLKWHWPDACRQPGGALGSCGTIAAPTSNQVMMAPMVANLTDDDGNGIVDARDVPDVVFTTFVGSAYGTGGVLRAVRGDSGLPIWSVTSPTEAVQPGGQVAIGDIDNDGLPEIVACRGRASDGTGGPLIAFEHDGTLKWTSSGASLRCGQAAPAIADLDADGDVEVFVRYGVVRGTDGVVLDVEACAGTQNVDHDPCDYTTAADLDGDGRLEIVGGNVAFHFDEANGLVPLFDYRPGNAAGNAPRNDGYPAIADLDRDGTPEIVVVRSSWYRTGAPGAYYGDHHLQVFSADGSPRTPPIDINDPAFTNAADAAACWDPDADPATANSVCRVAGGGPPTIGNFDADPQPEIALAGAYDYGVFDLNPDATVLARLWARDTDDSSSRKTGSSLFDFDGDGVSEVVYSDHRWLRVYDGPTGDVRFCACNTSATLWEYPVIVDVDADGSADIVAVSNDAVGQSSCADAETPDPCTAAEVAAGRTAGTHGVRVFEGPAPGWVGTRRIWNQHTYHVTNVTESGAIPTVEPRNWLLASLNDFRLNIEPSAANRPDLRPRNASVDVRMCPTAMRVYAEVHNAGWAAAPAGVPVAFYRRTGPATFELVGVSHTTAPILPGQAELVFVDHAAGDGPPLSTVEFRIVVNDPAQAPLLTLEDCRLANDTTEVVGACLVVVPIE